MNKLVDQLVLYSELESSSILMQLADVFRHCEGGVLPRGALASRINKQVKRLLDLAMVYGFDRNLWQDYLSYVLATTETSFSLAVERRKIEIGTIKDIALADFEVFRQLFQFDFSVVEKQLGITSLSVVCSYSASAEFAGNRHREISSAIRSLSSRLSQANDANQFYDAMIGFYQDHGVGLLGLNRAFRIQDNQDLQGDHQAEGVTSCSFAAMRMNGADIVVINDTDEMLLSDLVGYDIQKEQLVANTESFIRGEAANNVLLYGDAGTGKSSCVKALVNEYRSSGLRIIELRKHQFKNLPMLISVLKSRNYHFIIFIDDLSFEENEIEYKFLKAAIEGGLESRPANVLIYATSNRRHLIRESWSDRSDMEHDGDVHRSDTVQEKTSLAARFGVAINFSKPAPALYHEIVKELALRKIENIPDDEVLFRLADRWGIRHGGMSGRSARQFVDSLAGFHPL